MPGFERRFEPVAHFETKPEMGGASTVILGAESDLGARVYASGEYPSVKKHQPLEHTGTLVVVRHQSAIEVINATMPEREGQSFMVRERAMALLTFAMLVEDAHNGNWTTEERIFINPSNEELVDPAYVAYLGLSRKRRIRRLHQGEVESEEIHQLKPAHRVAGEVQGDIRRIQVFPNPSPIPEGYREMNVDYETKKGVA